MATEGPRPDEPLSASIREQLQTKDALDAQSAEERQADQAQRARVEHRKADERAEVERHLQASGLAPDQWPERLAEVHARGRQEARLRDWGGRGLPLAGIALALLAVVTGRKLLFAVGLPLLAGALLLRNRGATALPLPARQP